MKLGATRLGILRVPVAIGAMAVVVAVALAMSSSSAPASNGVATAIGLGSIHSCAVMTGGGAMCWGDNEYGQLGDNQNCGYNECPNPVQVTGLTSGVAAIDGAYYHTCAVMTGGGVKLGVQRRRPGRGRHDL